MIRVFTVVAFNLIRQLMDKMASLSLRLLFFIGLVGSEGLVLIGPLIHHPERFSKQNLAKPPPYVNVLSLDCISVQSSNTLVYFAGDATIVDLISDDKESIYRSGGVTFVLVMSG